VGIKPTVGLTSRYLIIPVSEHQDTVGPIARTVKDAAKLLQVLVGVDEMDVYTMGSPFKDHVPDYLASCKLLGLKNKRIGIARNVMVESQYDTQYTISAFERAISTMKAEGSTIIDHTDFTAFGEWKKRKYNPVTRADFASNIVQFFSKLTHNPNNIDSIESLRDFTWTHPLEDYPAKNTANWDVAIERKWNNNTCPDFKDLYQENIYFGGEGGILGALERHNLDAIVLPTAIAYEIPALVGTPIITVPLGAAAADTPVTLEASGNVVEMAPGVPFGISFLGARWSEQTLIEIAYAFEQKTQVRRTLKRVIEL
jgi:amidase